MSIAEPITDLRNTGEASELLDILQKLSEAEELAGSGILNIDGHEVFDRLREKYGRKTT